AESYYRKMVWRCWIRGGINDSDGGERRPGGAAPIQQGAEVPVLEGIGGHQGGGDGAGVASAAALRVEKEERAVAAIVEFRDPNRSAKDRAELILAERGLLHTRRAGRCEVILEEAFGIKPVVADEVVGRSVKLVGARPHYHDQLCAGV